VSRVVVVHWKPELASEGLAALRNVGHEVEVYADQGGVGLARFKKQLPDVVLISLERLPSHGRAIGQWFRTTKATAAVPLIFVGGVEEKVALARTMFSDAIFCSWADAKTAIKKALQTPQSAIPEPICSAKNLWRKLEIREGDKVLQLGGPADLRGILGEDLPLDVTLLRRVNPIVKKPKQLDIVLLFAANQVDLRNWFEFAASITPEKRPLWICRPKLSSGVKTDITQGDVFDRLRGAGWTDVKVCRVDDIWTGHMLRRRKA
jgi:CheY-like chemotaxis protein